MTMSSRHLERGRRTPESAPSEATKTVVSCLISVHLFCVLIALSGNVTPSGLQQRLAEILSPYITNLHLTTQFKPYELIEDQSHIELHRWLVSLESGKVMSFPTETQWQTGFPHHRWEAFGRFGAMYAEAEVDEIPAEFAKGLANHALSAHAAKHAEQVLVQCVRYPGSESGSPEDNTVIYEADVWRNKDGDLEVLKRSPEQHVAPPTVQDAN